MATWTKGAFNAYHCNAAGFVLRIQQTYKGDWATDHNGLRLQARWQDVETAKCEALKAWRRVFMAAAEACGSSD